MVHLRRILLLLPCILTVSAAPNRAAANEWTPAGLAGGVVRCLAIDPDTSTTLYAGTSLDGVFNTTDGGASWKRVALAGADVRTLAIDPSAPANLYAGTTAGLFKSTDRGQTWIDTTGSDVGILSLIIDAAAPRTVYAGTATAGILKTEDGGAHWQNASVGLPQGAGVTAITIDPRPPQTIYAAPSVPGSRPVFKSTDGAATWERFSDGDSYLDISALAFNAALDTLYWTVNALVEVDAAGVVAGGDYATLVGRVYGGTVLVDPDHPGTVYAAGSAVFKTTSVDKHFQHTVWQEMNTGLPMAHLTEQLITTLVMDRHKTGTWYVATTVGVFKSTDGAVTWSPIGLPSSGVTALALEHGAARGILAGTSYGVYQVGAGGGWTGGGPSGRPPGATVRALVTDPRHPDVVLSGTDSGLLRSTDHGVTWAPSTLRAAVIALVRDPQTPATIYAGTDSGIFRSTDGSDSWEWTSLRNTFVGSLAIDERAPQTLYAGTEFGLSTSTDGTSTWNRLALPAVAVNAITMDARRPDVLYAATAIGLFTSSDAGSAWSASGNGLPAGTAVVALATDPRTPGTLYAATQGAGVFTSSDGGATWVALNAGLPSDSEVTALAIDPQLPVTIYAGTQGAQPGKGLFSLQQPMPCVGDCFGTHTVTVDDVLLAVNIALGNRAIDDCTVMDVDWNGRVTIDELLVAINNALTSCAATP